MNVIEAAAVSVKTMADNTLRLTVDIEPRYAKAAFELFGERGTPMALAALVVGAPKPEKAPEQPGKAKGGPLAQSAGIICKDPKFQVFAEDEGYMSTEDGATELIYAYCNISSRVELDSDRGAGRAFEHLMGRYRAYLSSIGAAA